MRTPLSGLLIRRLKYLVHTFGTEGALHEITNSYGPNESRETRILAFLLCDIVGKDLGRVEGSLVLR